MISNLIVLALLLVAAASFIALTLRAHRHDDWRAYTPRTNEERLLRYIERRAHWEGEQRKERALRQARMDAALDRRAAAQVGNVRTLRPHLRRVA